MIVIVFLLNKTLFSFIIGYCLAGFGLFQINWCPRLPYSIDIALMVQVYLLLGYMIKEKKPEIKYKNIIKIFAVILFCIFICLITYLCDKTNIFIMDINLRQISIISIIFSFLGMYFIYIISDFINKIPIVKNVFILFGKASLILFLFQHSGLPIFSDFFGYNLYKISNTLNVFIRLIQCILIYCYFKLMPFLNKIF